MTFFKKEEEYIINDLVSRFQKNQNEEEEEEEMLKRERES